MKTIKKKGKQLAQLAQSHSRSSRSSSSESRTPKDGPQPPDAAIANAGNATPPPATSDIIPATILQAIKTSLNVLAQSSDAFPPLKSAVGGLVAIISLFDTAAGNYSQFTDMKNELDGLVSVIAKFQGKSMHFRVEKRLNSMAEAIELQRKAISQILAKSKMERILYGSEDAQKIQSIIQSINSIMNKFQLDITQSIELDVMDLQNMAIQDRLRAVSDASFKAEPHSSCMENTRVAILSLLLSWATEPKSSPVFWLSGIAGTGKSTIAQSLCELLDQHKLLGGSFFCSRDSAERSDVKRIIPTIAESLSLQHLVYQAQLSERLKEEPGIASQSLKRQFELLLLAPLKAVAGKQAFKDQIIVIDALDECSDSQATRMILSLLMAHAASLPFKIFLSSRPDVLIQEELQQADYKETFSLHDVESDIVQEDINLYLTAKLKNLPHRAKLETEFPDFVLQLTKLSDRLFIYAFTVQSYLRGPNPLSRFKALLAFKADGLSSINQLYTQVLKISLSKLEVLQQAEIEQNHLRCILHTVVCLFNPLSMRQIQDLLTTQGDIDVEALLPSFHSLLSIPESGKSDHPITVFHASFADYIVHKQCLPEYHLNPEEHHAFLSLCCLKYMNNRLQKNPCHLQVDTDIESISPSTLIQHFQSMPAMPYSCQHWADHWAHAGNKIGAEHLDILQLFMEKHLLEWLEQMSLLRKIADCAPGLYKVSQSLKKLDLPDCMENIQNLTLWLHEGRAFILQAIDCLSKKPLEVYHAALIWLPTDSILNIYKHNANSSIKVLSGVDQNWDVCEQVFRHQGHGHVYCVVISPNSQQVLCGLSSGAVKIWSIAAGEVEHDLDGHTDIVRSVAFSSSSNLVASASNDGDVRIWNAATGEAEFVLKGHSDWIASVVFSSDGQLVVSASEDGDVRIWNVATGEIKHVLKGHSKGVNSAAFSPNNLRVVSCSTDHDVRIWDVVTGLLVLVLKGHSDRVTSAAFFPNDQQVVSGSLDSCLRIWNSVTGELKHNLNTSSPIHFMAFSAYSEQVVSASRGGHIRVWSAVTGNLEQELEGHLDKVYSVAISPDGQQVVSGSSEGKIRIWSTEARTIKQLLQGHLGWINAVAFSSSGQQIVSGSFEEVRVWATAREKTLEEHTDRHSGSVSSVVFSSNGLHLASGYDLGDIRVWDTRTGEMIHLLQGHAASILSLVFSPHGQQVISGSKDKDIRIWNTTTGKEEHVLTGHLSWVMSLAVSSNGQRVVSGAGDYDIRIWDVATGKMEHLLQGHRAKVNSVAFSPQDQRLVSGSDDRDVRIWNATTGALEHVVEGHSASVNSVAFFSDGQQVVSGSHDHGVRIWSASSKNVMQRFQASFPVVSASFLSNGLQVLAKGRDAQFEVFDMSANHGSAAGPSAPFYHLSLKDKSSLALHFPGSSGTGKSKHVLWIPPKYRDIKTLAQHGSKVCFGHESGSITILDVSSEI